MFTKEIADSMAKVTDVETMARFMEFVNQPALNGLTPAEAFQKLQDTRTLMAFRANLAEAGLEEMELEARQYDDN